MNAAWWGPIGSAGVLFLGWLLNQWTKRVERKAEEKRKADERAEKERKDRDEWEARRVDVAKDVSEAWNPVFEGMSTEMSRLNEKCNQCAKDNMLIRKDFGEFIDSMEAWADDLAQQVTVPADSQRRARVMFTAARQSHLSHNRSE